MIKQRNGKKHTNNADDNVKLLVLLNIIIPGLGSYLVGDKKSGTTQLILWIIGIIVSITIIFAFVGAILWLIAWIWGLITIIKVLSK
jgi:hypothetical protein